MLELFFDFDNTVTQGDVLDRVIERYSRTDSWREWEAEWQAGRMSTVECLHRQVGSLEVSLTELEAFLSDVRLDPHFADIHAWAESRGVRLSILSDNFLPLISAILRRHGLGSIPVFANGLGLGKEGLEALFPWRDPTCARCAHCKAIQVRSCERRPRLFVGDGLSDVCGALAADIVFAKDSLAATLVQRKVAFHRYASLADVLSFLRAHERELVSHHASAAR